METDAYQRRLHQAAIEGAIDGLYTSLQTREPTEKEIDTFAYYGLRLARYQRRKQGEPKGR